MNRISWHCDEQAILRSVPPLSKYYILRMLYVDKGLPISMIQSWAKNTPSKHRRALEILLKLKLAMKEKKKSSSSGTKEKALRLHPAFRRQLRASYQGMPQKQQEQQVWNDAKRSGNDRYSHFACVITPAYIELFGARPKKMFRLATLPELERRIV